MGNSLIKFGIDLGGAEGGGAEVRVCGAGLRSAVPARKGSGKEPEPGGDGCGLWSGPPHRRARGLLLTPQSRGRGRKIYYPSTILLSVCSLLWPRHFICWFLFSECMLPICYSNSCYNSWAIGLIFYWAELKRMHFNKKPEQYTNGLTLMYLHKDELYGLAWHDF